MNHKGLRFTKANGTFLTHASHRFNVSSIKTDGFWHSFCLEWYLYMLRVNLCPEAVSVVFFFLFWAVMTAAAVKEAGVSWPCFQPVTGNVIFTAAPWKTISLLSAWLSCPSAPHRVGDAKNTSQWTSSHHSCQLTHNHVHLCCPAGKSFPVNWQKKKQIPMVHCKMQLFP